MRVQGAQADEDYRDDDFLSRVAALDHDGAGVATNTRLLDAPSPDTFHYDPFQLQHETSYGGMYPYGQQSASHQSQYTAQDLHYNNNIAWPGQFDQFPFHPNCSMDLGEDARYSQGHSSHGGSSSSVHPPFRGLSLQEGDEQEGDSSTYANEGDLDGDTRHLQVPHTFRHEYISEQGRTSPQHNTRNDVEIQLQFHPPGRLIREQQYREMRKLEEQERVSQNPDASVWYLLEKEEQEELVEVVSKRRGLRFDTIRRALRIWLTKEIKEAIFSRDLDLIDSTLLQIFPVTTRHPPPTWMHEMSGEDCERLVQRLCDASGKSKELVRNFLLQMKSPAEYAHDLLNAPDSDIVAYAERGGLIPHTVKTIKNYYEEGTATLPWQLDLDTRQRGRVRDIIMRTCGKEAKWAYKALKQDHVFPFFGREILREEHSGRLKYLIDYMRYGRPLPDDDR
ncbi:hypothetical protein CBS101457_000285 [Exobasidium rhododendri]|nr:hypothetical protein CBS101457_000285 [Exobasidium rhododendri]